MVQGIDRLMQLTKRCLIPSDDIQTSIGKVTTCHLKSSNIDRNFKMVAGRHFGKDDKKEVVETSC